MLCRRLGLCRVRELRLWSAGCLIWMRFFRIEGLFRITLHLQPQKALNPQSFNPSTQIFVIMTVSTELVCLGCRDPDLRPEEGRLRQEKRPPFSSTGSECMYIYIRMICVHMHISKLATIRTTITVTTIAMTVLRRWMQHKANTDNIAGINFDSERGTLNFLALYTSSY